MSKFKFADTEENVVTRQDFSLDKARNILKNECIAIIGYGIQGPAQALNLKDNGLNVIVGQREYTSSWQKAIDDGWTPGLNLFPIEEACKKGTFICNLLSDAAQIQLWPIIREYLNAGKTLCFSHGFSIVYSEQSNIIPPKNIDVILVAPKGSGRSVRTFFLADKGINSSYAIHQNVSNKAEEKALAFGIAIGSGFLFETSFKNEVTSDLCGERGVLMGALAGIIYAQYQTLREHGHSPSESFNETVEELTQSLVPLIAERGMDWMFKNCSTTAQRGALDWMPKFKDAVLPVFQSLYESVESGKEASIVIAANSKPDYKEKLNEELEHMHNDEIWRAGKTVRSLRP